MNIPNKYSLIVQLIYSISLSVNSSFRMLVEHDPFLHKYCGSVLLSIASSDFLVFENKKIHEH